MGAAGIIFSNVHESALSELTRARTMASVPFAGRYRLIDFALSNLVNSGISTVGLITKRNYQSLMDHVGSGKDWDLSRKNGGLIIFPPFGQEANDSLYISRLAGLKGIMGFLSKAKADQFVLMDSNFVCNIDLRKVIAFHEEKKADITIVYKEGKVTQPLNHNMSIQLNDQGRIVDASLITSPTECGKYCANIWIINKGLLNELVSSAIAKNQTSFETDIILANIHGLNMYGYLLEGSYFQFTSTEEYFKNNMKVLLPEVREELFKQRGRLIYTKIRDSAPTKYGNHAKVVNSFIADGCVIEGYVENSILFRGVKIDKNTVVKNSILMQDTITGENVTLNYVITDKNVVIRDRNHLSGAQTHPFFISKGTMI